MKKLNKVEANILKLFVDTFDLEIKFDGKEVSFESALSILEGKFPSPLTAEQKKGMFIETMKPFVDQYERDMLNKFYRYWTKEEGTRLKYELQDTWNLAQRLSNWKRNDEEYKRKQYIDQLNKTL
jgi:hypothetical protein